MDLSRKEKTAIAMASELESHRLKMVAVTVGLTNKPGITKIVGEKALAKKKRFKVFLRIIDPARLMNWDWQWLQFKD
jgi:hypothetical protein